MWWIALLIAGIFLLAAGLWLLKYQNRLIRMDASCAQELSAIGKEMDAFWESLSPLLPLALSCDETFCAPLVEAFHWHKKITAQSSISTVRREREQLAQAYQLIRQLGERYPDFAQSSAYHAVARHKESLQKEMERACARYNETVLAYNQVLQEKVTRILARQMHYSVREALS